MNSNLWPMLIRILFPVPACFLVLVCLPMPSRARRFVTRWIVKFFDKIFSFRVLGVSLIYMIMATSCALFCAMCVETYGLRVRELKAFDYADKMALRGRRWRAERNFYIAFMFLACSIVANRVRLLLKEMESLKEELREVRAR